MNGRKVSSDRFNWDFMEDMYEEDKSSLYDSQENIYTLAIYFGINFPFVNFEGKKCYILGR